MNQLQSNYWITSLPVRYWLLPNEKMYKKQAEWYKKHSKTP